MNRDAVMAIVKKYIADAIDDIDLDNLDTSQSMRDIGVNSLDIVEIVSRSMRELKIKVPRAELNKLDNIDSLVDLLWKTFEESGASTPAMN